MGRGSTRAGLIRRRWTNSHPSALQRTFRLVGMAYRSVRNCNRNHSCGMGPESASSAARTYLGIGFATAGYTEGVKTQVTPMVKFAYSEAGGIVLPAAEEAPVRLPFENDPKRVEDLIGQIAKLQPGVVERLDAFMKAISEDSDKPGSEL